MAEEDVRGCVAVAVAEGTDLSGTVGEHFGRSPRFLLVREGSGNEVEVLENDHAEAPQGAGPATASLLRRHGVTAVLAGRFGPRAEDALRAAGILPVSVAPGTGVADALAWHVADGIPEAG
jgi:predicted Fe-Mo cluster-binding NifX family protein